MFEGLFTSQALLLFLAWLAYFAIHSLLASLAVKQRVVNRLPWVLPVYRLLYNLLAVLLLLPPLYLLYASDWVRLWHWGGIAWWLMNSLAAVAVVMFISTLRYYDGSEFFGIQQWRLQARRIEDQEAFHLSPMHRFVRHPWYFLGLILIWSRDMNAGVFISATVITIYFFIGSRLEERKLLVYHGDLYRRYRSLVPGLLPLPWRYLTQKQAEELISGARHE